jgi:hypothetical protein
MRAAIAALDAGGPDVPAVLARLRADVEANRDHFGALHMDLGFRYASGALVGDGARAPHVWLDRGGKRLSSLDLFGRDFVLLVAGDPSAWRWPGALEVASGAPFGLEPGGALLVRPDGHVAWRALTRPAQPAETLAAVLRDVARAAA